MTSSLIDPATTIQRLRPSNEISRALPIFPLLSAILVVQLAVMVTLQNTAFQDEALSLFAGRDILDAWSSGTAPTTGYGATLSGFPEFYPVVAGFLDRLGGLQLARGLSMVSGLWITVVVFLLGRRLFSDRVALLGAAFFALQAPVLFIGRLATYDAFSLALLGSALAIATTRPRWWKTAAVVALCTAAPVAKYATIAFVPSALVVCAALIFLRSGRSAVLRQGLVALVSALVFAGIVVVVFRGDPDALTGLVSTTIHRTVTDRSPAGTVLLEGLRVLGVFAVLAVIGLVLLIRKKPSAPKLLVSILLVASVFIAPVYHVVTGELTSFDKHMAFGMLFGAPLVGYLFSRFLDSHRITQLQGLAVAVAVFLVIFGLNLSVAQRLFTAWPNSSKMIISLKELVRLDNTRVLAEGMEVPRYYLTGDGGISAYWQYTGLDYFRYTEPQSGATLTGDAAYRDAIEHGYFQVVVLDYTQDPVEAKALVAQLRGDSHYSLAETIPFTTSSGTSAYQVWRLVRPVASK
ncbi:ArnT family glycosyltransferase [Frondihabitans cladoniiphilus]|uniref:DUF3824 domain-containing protein n=1 Tax=Frondihabitans cladoniiphilus TaxID=715785 RepID=A0ABP8VR52_9MICO